MQRLLIAASAVAVAGFMAPPARPASVRMDASVDSILEDIKGLTLVEASELVSKIEETFGVDASSAPVAMAVAGGAAAGGGDEAADEKDEFDVVLTEVPADKKIAVLKIVRTITGLGLKARDRRLFRRRSVSRSPFFLPRRRPRAWSSRRRSRSRRARPRTRPRTSRSRSRRAAPRSSSSRALRFLPVNICPLSHSPRDRRVDGVDHWQ